MLIYLLLTTFLIKTTCAINVLVWATTIGRSHVSFMGGLADLIINDGNNVTLVLLKNDPDVNITGSKNVENIIRFESSLIERDEWSYFNFKQSEVFKTKTIDMGDFFKMQSVNSRICRSLLDDPEMLSTLKNGNFDVAVVEFFHFCPAGIFELVGIKKVILATALGMTHAHYELLNLDVPLSYVPVQMTHLGSRIDIWGRAYNILFHLASKFCYRYILWQDQQVFNERYGTFASLEQLYKNQIDYVFTNTNEFTESTRPTLQRIKYIGGSTTPEAEPLNKDFETILSRPAKGTILFSLGSLLKSHEMPDFIKSAFFEAFKAFPDYTFIWKSDESFNNFSCPNVYFRDWVPQVDLLADTRLKAFITHCGMNSVQESLFFGVPLISLPIFADQDSNAVIAQERGYAYGLDKFTVTRDDVIKALRAVLAENSRYSSKARLASRILRENQKSMKEEIVKLVKLSGTTEKLDHLRVNSEQLNVMQYYNLDVYIVVSLIPLLTYCLVRLNIVIRVRIAKHDSRKKSYVSVK